jgi:hypothetical protein
MEVLRRRLQHDAESSGRPSDEFLAEYIRHQVLPKLGSIRNMPVQAIVRKFDETREHLPKGFINDMGELGYVSKEGSLTRKGINFLLQVSSSVE